MYRVTVEGTYRQKTRIQLFKLFGKMIEVGGKWQEQKFKWSQDVHTPKGTMVLAPLKKVPVSIGLEWGNGISVNLQIMGMKVADYEIELFEGFREDFNLTPWKGVNVKGHARLEKL